MSQCVMCRRTSDEVAVFWAIVVQIGRTTETREVCNACELAYRVQRRKDLESSDNGAR